MALLGVAALETASIHSDRVSLGVATAVFFGAYAVLLLTAAWALAHGQAWARGPVLLTQLIVLGVAWSLRGELPMVLTAVLVVAALVAVTGIVHPASIAHLARDGDEGAG